MRAQILAADLRALPVIDNHCHFFMTTPPSPDLAAVINLSKQEIPSTQLDQTILFRVFIRELGLYMNLPGASAGQILNERARRMNRDYHGWVADLFADAGIATLLIDKGYQPASQPLDLFESMAPCPVRYFFRMENALDPLWAAFRQGKIDFKTAEERYYHALDTELEQDKIIGLKSIIGYRTGLEIRPRNRSDLIGGQAGEKAFRDFFLVSTLRRVASRSLPVQIHASFGESHVDIRKNHPGMLKYVFEQKDLCTLPLVLVHGGYPRSFEAGFLASVYPNVYVDVSEMVPFAPLGAKQGIMDILNMCPINKILYGSDGFVIPEIHWLGARMIRRIMAAILSELIEDGLFDRDDALRVAQKIFADNAKTLYGITPGI